MSLLHELSGMMDLTESSNTYSWPKFLDAFKRELYRICETKHQEELRVGLFHMDEFHPFDSQPAIERALAEGNVFDLTTALLDAFDESIGLLEGYFGYGADGKPTIVIHYDEHSDEHVMNVIRKGAPELYKTLDLKESHAAYARRGNKIVRKIRCTAGKRKGRIVNSAADCFKRKNLKIARKARLSSKRTRFIRIRKTRLTLKRSVSKTVRRLNSH